MLYISSTDFAGSKIPSLLSNDSNSQYKRTNYKHDILETLLFSKARNTTDLEHPKEDKNDIEDIDFSEYLNGFDDSIPKITHDSNPEVENRTSNHSDENSQISSNDSNESTFLSIEGNICPNQVDHHYN